MAKILSLSPILRRTKLLYSPKRKAPKLHLLQWKVPKLRRIYIDYTYFSTGIASRRTRLRIQTYVDVRLQRPINLDAIYQNELHSDLSRDDNDIAMVELQSLRPHPNYMRVPSNHAQDGPTSPQPSSPYVIARRRNSIYRSANDYAWWLVKHTSHGRHY